MKRSFLWLASTILWASAAGCSKHAVRLDAAHDPAAQATKTEPIFLEIADPNSAEARLAALVLRTEMCRGGFRLAATPERARWRLRFDYVTQIETGTSVRVGVFVPNVSVRKIKDATTATHMALSPMADSPDKTPLPVWEATASGPGKVFEIYRPVIFHEMLARWGTDWANPVKLDRDYLEYTQTAAGRCQPGAVATNP